MQEAFVNDQVPTPHNGNITDEVEHQRGSNDGVKTIPLHVERLFEAADVIDELLARVK